MHGLKAEGSSSPLIDRIANRTPLRFADGLIVELFRIVKLAFALSLLEYDFMDY
jgi:hypothetical protein